MGEVVGAAAGADEFFQVGAAAEGFADVVGEGADIGSFAAGNVEGELGVGVVDEGDFKGDGDGLSFNFDPFSSEFVEFFPLDFFGAKHGWDLLNGSLELGEDGFDFGEGRDGVVLGGDFSLRVVGGGFDAEVEGGFVFFVLVEEGVGLSGEFSADEEDHESFCKGIEGACVADFFDLGLFAPGADEAE